MTFPVPGGATFLRSRSNLADVASPAAALADLGGLGLAATTGPAGFALQNATPVILTWTAPNDGLMHRVIVLGQVRVTLAQTGGAIGTGETYPDGSASTDTLDAGGHSATHQIFTPRSVLIQAGSIFTVNQTSAMTAGTAIAWAELWAL